MGDVWDRRMCVGVGGGGGEVMYTALNNIFPMR